MKDEIIIENGKCYKVIYSRYITKKGRRYYRKNGGVFRFKVEVDCSCCK